MDDFEREDDMDPDMEEGMEAFMLADEDGKEYPFEMIGDIEFEGAHYALMSPVDAEDEEFDMADDEDAQPVVILQMQEGEDNDMILTSVTDDALLDRIFDAFMKTHPELFEDDED